MDKIEAGDVVQLKSGGPLMTATSGAAKEDGETVYCAGFTADGTPFENEYPLEALKAAA